MEIWHQPLLLEVLRGGHAHVALLPGQVLVDPTAAQMSPRIPVLRHQLLPGQVPENGRVLGQLIAVIRDGRQLTEPVHLVPELSRQVFAWNGFNGWGGGGCD